DLEQPLLAVGELMGRPIAALREPQRAQDRVRLIDRIGIGRQLAPPGAGITPPLAYRERDRLERVEVGKQGVDLERAHQPALDALLGPERRDLVPTEHDAAAVRLEHAGHQVDQRGLAGAVWPDQRIALAGRKIERDVLGDDERAEALVQATRGERRGAHALLRANSLSRARPPRMPFGKRITTATSSVPTKKYQFWGLMPEN